jgi:hypothetical protein
VLPAASATTVHDPIASPESVAPLNEHVGVPRLALRLNATVNPELAEAASVVDPFTTTAAGCAKVMVWLNCDLGSVTLPGYFGETGTLGAFSAASLLRIESASA